MAATERASAAPKAVPVLNTSTLDDDRLEKLQDENEQLRQKVAELRALILKEKRRADLAGVELTSLKTVLDELDGQKVSTASAQRSQLLAKENQKLGAQLRNSRAQNSLLNSQLVNKQGKLEQVLEKNAQLVEALAVLRSERRHKLLMSILYGLGRGLRGLYRWVRGIHFFGMPSTLPQLKWYRLTKEFPRENGVYWVSNGLHCATALYSKEEGKFKGLMDFEIRYWGKVVQQH